MSKTQDNLKLSSIKVHEHMHELSKIEFVRTKFNYQKLVNRALFLYLYDVNFRNQIHQCNALATSGSL